MGEREQTVQPRIVGSYTLDCPEKRDRRFVRLWHLHMCAHVCVCVCVCVDIHVVLTISCPCSYTRAQNVHTTDKTLLPKVGE